MLKKICVVVPTHWTTRMGGAQYQAKCLVNGLIESKKYEVYCLSKNVNENNVDGDYNLINIANRKGLSRYGFVFDIFRLFKILNRIKPDIIYQRVGCAYTGVCAHYARKNHIKMIWNIAHENDVSPQEYLASPIFLVKYIDKYILEYGIKHATHIIAQTKRQSEMMQSSYARQADEVIYNFHPFPSEKIIKDRDQVNVLWVANLKPWKKPEAFIELASRFESQNKNKARFVMIGEPSADTGWQNKMNKRIAQLNNLVYLGKLNQDQVNEEMAIADIFVNSSLFEGFANTFIQAWMRKVPVVSLHFNPDKLLSSGTIGLYSGNMDQLVSDVMLLVDDCEKRKIMGETAQQYAFEHHSFKNIDKIMDLFETQEMK